MGITRWLRKKSYEKSVANILEDLRPLVAAVRTDTNDSIAEAGRLGALAQAADQQSRGLLKGDAFDQLRALERWRIRKGKVVEAQKKLYQDVALWSSCPPERSFNEIILPLLYSGELVASWEACFEPAIVAAYRVCASAAQQRGVELEAHTPPKILQRARETGDLYK